MNKNDVSAEFDKFREKHREETKLSPFDYEFYPTTNEDYSGFVKYVEQAKPKGTFMSVAGGIDAALSMLGKGDFENALFFDIDPAAIDYLHLRLKVLEESPTRIDYLNNLLGLQIPATAKSAEDIRGYLKDAKQESKTLYEQVKSAVKTGMPYIESSSPEKYMDSVDFEGLGIKVNAPKPLEMLKAGQLAYMWSGPVSPQTPLIEKSWLADDKAYATVKQMWEEGKIKGVVSNLAGEKLYQTAAELKPKDEVTLYVSNIPYWLRQSGDENWKTLETGFKTLADKIGAYGGEYKVSVLGSYTVGGSGDYTYFSGNYSGGKLQENYKSSTSQRSEGKV